MTLTISEVIMRSAIISHLRFTTSASVSHFSALLHGTFNRNPTTITVVLYCTTSLEDICSSSARTYEEHKSEQTNSLFHVRFHSAQQEHVRRRAVQEVCTNASRTRILSLAHLAIGPTFVVLRGQYGWFLLELHTHLEPSTEM